jgi:Rrf2 family protein
MLLSKKTRYAMIALIKLAQDYGKGAILISDIAKSENIPQRFLENILLELKKLGYLGSRLGKSGGYYLLRKPEEITLLDIIRHFEGTIAMLSCVSEKSYQPCEFCKDEALCKIRHVFKKVRDNTFDLLSKTSLKDLSFVG